MTDRSRRPDNSFLKGDGEQLGKVSIGYQKYPWPLVLYWFIFKPKSHLHTSGWIESLKRGYPCKEDGTYVPWMNYSIISFLEERLKKNLNLFEFGSGYSTLFYARLVNNVTSVESDSNWFSTVQEKLPTNVNLIFQEEDLDGKYCRSITQTERLFDVVIVDGKDRVNCVKQSVQSLTNKGIVILDDAERKDYKEAFDFMAAHEFRALSFEGLKPNDIEFRRSTVFYKDDNCFDI